MDMAKNQNPHESTELIMPNTNILGKRFHFETYGTGQQLLFIHGSIGSHRTWDLQHPLAKHFKLILIDLLGHGDSEPLNQDISIKRLTDHLAIFIKKHCKKPLIAIGHSMGGAICQQLATDYSHLLRALILIGTGAKLGVLPSILKALETNYHESIELTIGQLGFASEADTKLISKVKRECQSCNPSIAYQDFKACNDFDIRGSLSLITLPTLIIVGNEDKLTPVKWSEYLAENIVNSQFVQINDAGHFVMLEQSIQLNNVISDFVYGLNSKNNGD